MGMLFLPFKRRRGRLRPCSIDVLSKMLLWTIVLLVCFMGIFNLHTMFNITVEFEQAQPFDDVINTPDTQSQPKTVHRKKLVSQRTAHAYYGLPDVPGNPGASPQVVPEIEVDEWKYQRPIEDANMAAHLAHAHGGATSHLLRRPLLKDSGNTENGFETNAAVINTKKHNTNVNIKVGVDINNVHITSSNKQIGVVDINAQYDILQTQLNKPLPSNNKVFRDKIYQRIFDHNTLSISYSGGKNDSKQIEATRDFVNNYYAAREGTYISDINTAGSKPYGAIIPQGSWLRGEPREQGIDKSLTAMNPVAPGMDLPASNINNVIATQLESYKPCNSAVVGSDNMLHETRNNPLANPSDLSAGENINFTLQRTNETVVSTIDTAATVRNKGTSSKNDGDIMNPDVLNKTTGSGDNRVRRLPGAIIIGAKKAGTRALLEYLRMHPLVDAPGPEPHFFDRNYECGFEWYRQQMPLTSVGQLTMEKTPSYLTTRKAPERMYSMSSRIRLLVVVRDPVTRAISDYTQAALYRKGFPSFEHMAFRSDGSVNASWGGIRIGQYVRWLAPWLERFPRSQLLIVDGEQLIQQPAAVMARVQNFLRLPQLINENNFQLNTTKGLPCLLRPKDNGRPHCLGNTKGREHPVVTPYAISKLRNYFRPYNEQLFRRIGEKFAWYT